MSEMRALVVEDSQAWQEIVSEILHDMGLAVDVAPNLETAIEQLRCTPHRLAVVDLSLRADDEANRDGLAVLEAIGRLDPGCVPLLLTGFATVEIAVDALTQYGAFTCLRKEAFKRGELRDVVRRVLAFAPAPEADHDRPSTPESAQGPDKHRRLALVVEDDSGWRSLLSELIADAGMESRIASSYGEALGYVRRDPPSLAVVDLSLASSTHRDANRDGFRILREAKALRVPAIVVSGYAEAGDIERLYLEFDVFAFLEKQAFQRVSFIQAVVDAIGSGTGREGDPIRLTRREQDVMALIERGLTNKGIARELTISENTVKRYLKSIFEKLDVDSRAAAVAKTMSAARH